jgi:hypothetical protein
MGSYVVGYWLFSYQAVICPEEENQRTEGRIKGGTMFWILVGCLFWTMTGKWICAVLGLILCFTDPISRPHISIGKKKKKS